jgi:hypothetical protein
MKGVETMKRVGDVKFPDGAVYVYGTDTEIERFGECLLACGGLLQGDETLEERGQEVLNVLQRYYPDTPRGDLQAWFETAQLHTPETMAPYVQMVRGFVGDLNARLAD